MYLTNSVVADEVQFANLQKSSSRGKAAYRSLQLFLRKGVEDKIYTSAICLRHDELLERGVSRAANVAVCQLEENKIH
jgi:hypothetical protein